MDKKQKDALIDFLADLSNRTELSTAEQLLDFFGGLEPSDMDVGLKFLIKKSKDKLLYIQKRKKL